MNIRNSDTNTAGHPPASSEGLGRVVGELLEELTEQITRLSTRERAVVDAIADGKLNREIAADLGVSVRTVESDRSQLVQKLDSKTTGEAIARYSRYRTLSALLGNGHALNGAEA